MGAGLVGAQGATPIVSVRPVEKELYKRLWETEAYRKVAPAERYVAEFLTLAEPKRGASVTDIGCGTGRAGKKLSEVGLKVTMLDFADNCLDPLVAAATYQNPDLRFCVHDLTQIIPEPTQYGFCCDVMEHIPPEQVASVLDHILLACQYVYLRIATAPDVCGSMVGHELHLSVHDYQWWHDELARRECKFLWSTEEEGSVGFYVSAWRDAKDMPKGLLNTSEEVLKEQLAANLEAGWSQVVPCPTLPHEEVMILGGGPSLNQFEKDIKKKHAAGIKIVTLNNTYHWCAERGLLPVTQVMVDGRAFNARFNHPVYDGCQYLIASHCHPDVLEGLPKDKTWLWHTDSPVVRDILMEHYDKTGEVWYGIPGGSTVMLRAIPLLRLLGYCNFHLYGCDSCLMGDEHHAYEQKENDSPLYIPVEVEGRMFRCHPWMASQAQEFMGLVPTMGDVLQLKVYGDGLLATILNTAARLAQKGRE